MKFKRVEIQGFKSYLDKIDGTFDFTVKEGNPADIVSIYAPNGFGKTSFYDAIDFCMTNNITRYIRDSGLANIHNTDAKELNQKGQKQYILRSKSAPDDLETIVKVFTDGDEYQRKVSSPRSGSKDYSFENKKTEPEERYFRSVMLTQEAVDGFLRELKPESRYERFMEEQLGGDNSLEVTRQQIQLMLSTLKSKLVKLEDEAKDINDKNLMKERNSETNFDSNCLLTTNNFIVELNKQGCNLNLLDDAFNEEKHANLELQINVHKSNINNEVTQFFSQKKYLESHLNSFTTYENHYNEIKKLKTIVDQLSKQEIDIKSYEELSNELQLLQEKRKADELHFKSLLAKEKEFPEFVKNIKLQSNLSKKTKEISVKLSENVSFFENKTAVLNDLEKQKNILFVARKEFNSKKKNATYYYSEIERLEAITEQLNSTAIETEQSELEEKSSDLKSIGLRLKNLMIENSDSFLEHDFINEKISLIVTEYLNIKSKNSELLSKKKDVEARIKKTKLENNSITKLIELGTELISQNQSESCPLCQHKYDSFEVLAESISTNSILSEYQQLLFQELEDCQTSIKLAEGTLEKLRVNFNIEKESHLIVLREQLRQIFEKKQLAKEKLKNLSLYRAELDKLKKITDYKEYEPFVSAVESELNKNYVLISEIEEKLAGVENERRVLTKEHTHLITELTIANNQENKVENFITDYSGFLTELKIANDSFKDHLNEGELKSSISEALKTLNHRFESRNENIKIVKAEVDILKELYSSSFFNHLPVNKEGLKTQKAKNTSQITELNSLLREFFTTVNRFNLGHLLEGDNWGSLKQRFADEVSTYHHKFEQSKAQINALGSLKELSGQVLDYVEFTKSTKRLNEVKQRIVSCESIKQTLIADLRLINDSLKSQIDQYFHVDLINTIYRKIDPHPDFKRITFQCLFSDEGKPKLQVYIENNEGNDTISPTLSFSSAQINVLSLSIFLAKALNVKNGKNDVDCIFIDDPVQSMDSINALGVIDLLRNLSVTHGKQIIISTHDDNFHGLLKQKLPPSLFNSKFLELESFGKVAFHQGQHNLVN